MSASIEQRNQDATAYCGNLDDQVSEELLWELMLQCGPVVNVHMPKDKVTGNHQSYGFVEFRTEDDAEYAIKVMNMVKLYGKPIRVNKASQDKKTLDIGANLFIGNLDADVDEKLLYDTFSAFGGITQPPKVMRDPDTGNPKGFGFIGFDSFEASDLAIECMNGQFLCNRQIIVQYAYKKDSRGERHGSQAERLLAASNPNKLKPHTMFAAAPGAVTGMNMNNMGASMIGMPMNAPPPPPPPPMMGASGMYGAPPPPPPQAYSAQMMAGAPPPPPPPPSQPPSRPPPPPPTSLPPPPPPPTSHPPPPAPPQAPPQGFSSAPPTSAPPASLNARPPPPPPPQQFSPQQFHQQGMPPHQQQHPQQHLQQPHPQQQQHHGQQQQHHAQQQHMPPPPMFHGGAPPPGAARGLANPNLMAAGGMGMMPPRGRGSHLVQPAWMQQQQQQQQR